MVDIHTHVLQGVDHGANNLTDSLKMLKNLEETGITKIYCTSHYYSDSESSEEFRKRYDTAFEELKANYKGKIVLKKGAEVQLSPFFGVGGIDPALKLEDNDYMLVELPFWRKLPDWAFNAIERVVLSGITPVIAHVERCLGARKKRIIKKLWKMGALMHVDSTSVGEDHFVDWCLKNGYVGIIASDYHVDIPYVPIEDALCYVEDKFGKEFADYICSVPDKLLI